MYKPVIKRFSAANNNQFIDCLNQTVNPSAFVEILEAILTYVKSPNRTSQQLDVTIEIYFTHPNPFLQTIRDTFTFKKSLREDITPLLFHSEKYILPNPLGIQVKPNNLLPDESIDLVIIYNEQIEKTIDELAAQYL